MKTSTEIFAHIDELNDAPESAMAEAIKPQVRATREHTIALLTIAGQVALLRENLPAQILVGNKKKD